MTAERTSGAKRHSMLGWLPGESLRRAQLDERVEWELRSALVRQLVHEKAFAEAAHVILAVVLGGVVLSDLGLQTTALWLGAVALAALIRARVRFRLRRVGGPINQQRLQVRRTVIALSLAWGLGAIVVAPDLPASHQMLVMVIFCGLTAVAPLSLVADPRSFWYLLSILLGTLTVALLRADMGEVTVAALVIVGLYGVSLARFFLRAHAQLVDTLRTSKRFEFSEQEVTRERAFLDALITSAPTAIAAVSRHGRVLGVNPAFEAMFGWTNEEVVGKDLDTLIVPAGGEAEAAELSRRVAEGRSVTTELDRLRADGEVLRVKVSAAPVQGIAQGGVFVVYEDVTALRRADAARREAEAQYRRLVDAASDMVFQVDRDGHWTFLNEAAGRLYDCHPEDLLGRLFTERVHPDYVERDLEAFAAVLDGEELSDYETVHVDLAGRPHTVSFSASPLCGPDGEFLGAQGMARDVTDRAEAREALRVARDQAERATQMKSSFLANMSHEIRTPLNGVLGMIEVLLDSKLTREQRAQAELIRNSADSLLSIINDILDFSKMEAGRLDLDEVAFAPAALIEELVRLYGPRASAKDVQLLADLDRGVPEAVVGDVTRIRQVLSNLITNAIKFTERGEVAVVMRLVGEGDGAVTVRFAVRDMGVGIGQDALSRIFNEFEQADVSTSRRFGGTGLGLAISQRLVRLMGGDIAVESTEGAGSEFAFALTMPRVDGAARHVAPRPSGFGRAGASRHILVAEDNPVNQEVARQMLERRGHRVQVVSNGRLAVERLQGGEAFDLVLMDVQMPEMDGLTATHAIRDAGLRIPIFALTANASGVERHRCIEAGMDGYLSKPFRPQELFALVEDRMEPAPDAPAPASDTPVDLDDFRAQLAEAGVAEAMDSMLELFLTQAAGQFDRLRDAVAGREAPDIRSAAHAYKSSAGTVRALPLMRLLGDMERHAAAGEVAEAVTAFPAVEEEHARVRAFLAQAGR